MKKTVKLQFVSALAASMSAMLLAAALPFTSFAAPESGNGWEQSEDGNWYWYEDGVLQGYDPDDSSYRGKEIYDEDTDAWYWLDNDNGGARAVSKDVYQESEAGQWGDIKSDSTSYGKWVRYDENGQMVKGWDVNENGTFYFDETYGTMAKGYATIAGKEYYFNAETGVLEREFGDVPVGEYGWKIIDGAAYWYENGIRQGYSLDASYRGKEIYDPDSDAWYWLDNVDGGKKAVSKDVYQESGAGDWAQNEDGTGKWVRYDENGHMVKGWSTNEKGTYYFDPVYGTMAKDIVTIDGVNYEFDKTTGILCSNYLKMEIITAQLYDSDGEVKSVTLPCSDGSDWTISGEKLYGWYDNDMEWHVSLTCPTDGIKYGPFAAELDVRVYYFDGTINCSEEINGKYLKGVAYYKWSFGDKEYGFEDVNVVSRQLGGTAYSIYDDGGIYYQYFAGYDKLADEQEYAFNTYSGINGEYIGVEKPTFASAIHNLRSRGVTGKNAYGGLNWSDEAADGFIWNISHAGE